MWGGACRGECYRFRERRVFVERQYDLCESGALLSLWEDASLRRVDYPERDSTGAGVGNFIRKHSIDELPQLINVFLGQMNLIGPRPGLPREVALYSEHDMKRLAVKPGCSGPWQVMGRSYLGFKEMVELDLRYIENRSLRQDLRLIFGTLKTMFSGEGAV